MAKATSYANDVLDQTYANAASGTDVIGSTTYTYPYRLKFQSTVNTASASGTEWATSGGYTAGGVPINGAFATAAAAGSKSNTAIISVTNAPAGTWADNEIVDSTGTPKRLVFRGGSSLAKTVNAGDTCSVAIGALTGTDA